MALLALIGLSGCTETVVYRQPAPPPQTVVVERGPSPAPPPRVEIRPAPPPYAVVWVPRSLALERLPLGLDPGTLSPGINSNDRNSASCQS
jgi:hypothetical protein